MKDLLLELIKVAGILLTAFVIPYITKKYSLADRQKTIATIESAAIWIREAVRWAEQTYVGTKRGQEKLEAVKKVMREKAPWLDDETIKILLESAVYEMNQAKEELKK